MSLYELLERVGDAATGPSLRVFALGSAILLSAACASTPPEGEAGTGNTETLEFAGTEVIVCEDIVTTGTRFARRVCWSETQREGQRESAERLIRGVRENSTIGDVQSGPGAFGPPVPQNQLE